MDNFEQIDGAAKNMDWQQVVLNGGPPCFHLESDGHFCGRAEAWAGHTDKDPHAFVSLFDLLHSERDRIFCPDFETATRMVGAHIHSQGRFYIEIAVDQKTKEVAWTFEPTK